jgi:RecA-family ATPase
MASLDADRAEIAAAIHRHKSNGPTTPPPTWLDRDEILARISFASWLNRDIPPLDRLLGDLLTTTTRMMLVAPTGLGKTNLALAIATAIPLGADFLHWRGAGRPRRALYIDGEMSERLMKQRVVDAARRAGMSEENIALLQANLFIVNRADFTDLPPLNTEAGQQYIDHIIEMIDGVDLIVFDNVQALTTGDMLDPVEWQKILGWMQKLTGQHIGQLWIHHTGHNEQQSYGTKTREWQLDTVALLERVVPKALSQHHAIHTHSRHVPTRLAASKWFEARQNATWFLADP